MSRTKASFSHLPLSVSEGRLAHIFHFQILTEVSHEGFVFTSSTFRFGGTSCTKAAFSHLTLSVSEGRRTKASFSHLPLSDFDGSLARKLRFHIFNVQIWGDVLLESFVFTSSTFRFGGTSCTKAAFSLLPLSDFEGSLARNLVFTS